MSLRSCLATVAASAAALSGCAALAPLSPAPESSAPATPLPSPPAAPTTASAVPGPTPTQPNEIEIDSVWNFRDAAGTGAGLPLTGGGHMARGVVFRSGKLKALSSADKQKLIDAGVTDIFDLRTDEVAKRTPDPEIGNATYHLVNVYGVYSVADSPAADAETAMAQREELTREYVTSPVKRDRVGRVLEGIAGAKGAVIIHCTEGKDRTGWVAAILQLVAGADEQVVMDEYLLSNERRAELIEAGVTKERKANGEQAAQVKRARLEVRDRYLQAGLDELTKRYGDLDGYLTDGLGLSQPTIDALRAKLVLG